MENNQRKGERSGGGRSSGRDTPVLAFSRTREEVEARGRGAKGWMQVLIGGDSTLGAGIKKSMEKQLGSN